MLDIIYEDNHLIIVNKEAGELVQGDKTGDFTLLEGVKAYVKKKYNKPGDVFLGLVHRLDRPVSGAVIFARTSKALTRMNEIFKNREIKKEYLAIVEHRPAEFEGHLVHYIIKDEERNISKVYDREKKGTKKVELSYELIGELYGMILLKVNPITGRSHQIRTQLSKINCPIVGDKKYGSIHEIDDRSICLHCHKLEFIHPVTKENIKIVADVPNANPWNNFSIEK
jgi:23S rRNA pseudouridine1911/1915/1917 synthase